MIINTRFWLLLATLSYALSAGAEGILEEITVTADFRQRDLVDVPFSVTALNAEFVRDNAVQHFEELVNIIPNVNWSGDGHRARYFQIRGVGELEQYQGAPNPSVGFLIDDIDFSGIGTVATSFDVESIEVLRGPQGSRYGANALGGLIYLRSAEPAAERNGRLQITAGSDDAVSLGAAMSGALNALQSTTFRVSAQRHTSNGFRDNTFLQREDTNGRDETSLRARLRLEPSDEFTANVSIVYSRLDNGYDAFSLDNSYRMLSDKPGKDAQQSLGASLRLDWSGDQELTVTSITSVADSDIEFSFDADWGNADSWAPVTYDYVSLSERSRKTLSQEFRLSKQRWLIGVYALHLNDRILTFNEGEYYDPFYDFADSLNDMFDSDFEATSIAAFGQYDYPISEATTFSAGLRIEQRSSDYSDSAGLATGPSDNMWGGEFSLQHEFTDWTGFVSVAKGYKAGGFNLGAAPDGKRDFGSEEMWTLETGVKARFQDNRLQINASLFHSRRVDQQTRSSTQLIPGDPASFVFFTDNVGKGRVSGVEAEIRWLPTDAWALYTNIGLLNAELQSGREQAHAPRYTFAAGIAYDNPNGFFLRADATAKDEFYFDVSHDQQSKPFELLNTSAGYQGEIWRVTVWARNVFDREYAVRGFYFGNEPPDFPNTLYTRPGDPRQIGVTIERSF